MGGKRPLHHVRFYSSVYPSEAVVHINVLKGHTRLISIRRLSASWLSHLGSPGSWSEGKIDCLTLVF